MNWYVLLADVVVAVHLLYVAFLLVGLAAILVGLGLRRSWARNFWFRTIHLVMIAIVAAESLCGIFCPLTDLEDWLRALGGQPNQPGSFLGRWSHDLLFVDVPPSSLALGYWAFGAAVLLLYLVAPPRRKTPIRS